MPLLRSRLPHCRIALAWAVAIAIAQAAATAAAIEPDWFPLHAGNRWVYDVHRDHSYQPTNDTIDRIFANGKSVQVVETTDRAPGAFLIRDTTTLRLSAGDAVEAVESTRLVDFANGLRLLAASEARPNATPTEARFEPPLRLLPTTTVGESWQAGTYRDGDLQADLQGEILGVENLDRDPACKGCLKVRYRGKVRGSVPIYQGNAKIESGTFERVIWLERGVGIVREVATTDAALRLPDGQSAKIFAVLTLRLVEHAVTK